MKWIFLVFFSVISMGCQGANENEAQIIKTSYPLADRGSNSLVIDVDGARKKGVLNNLPLLMVGDISSTVVKKLGYKPSFYYIAPNKSLNSKPHHLVMTYIFKHQSDDKYSLVVEEQSVVLIFSIDDKLESIIDSPVMRDVSRISLPVLR